MAYEDQWGFDPTVSLGVEPLKTLQSLTTPRSVSTATPQVAQAPTDPGDPTREFLAQVLLSLGEGFGGKTPDFLNKTLAERSKMRLAEAANTRLLERQRLNNEAILQRQEATDVRKEGRARSAEAAKAATEESKARTLGQAAMDVNEGALRHGIEAIDQSTRLGAENHLIKNGWKPEDARKYAQQLGTRWELSKDQSKVLQLDASTGRVIREVPRQVVEKVGESLVTRYGEKVLSTFLPPARQTLTPGQQVQQLPGVSVPGPDAPAEPARGLQPVGGLQGGASVIAEGPKVETPLTPDDRKALAGSKYAQVRTFEELDRVGGGKFLTDKLKEIRSTQKTADAERSADAYVARLEASERAKARAPIGKRALSFIQTRTLMHPPANSPTNEVEGGPEYVQLTPDRVKAVQGLPNIANNLNEIDEIVERRSDLFPRSTGNKYMDRASQAKARAQAWTIGTADPDIARLKALEIQVPTLIKVYGDTGNISLSERLTAVDALGLKADVAESIRARTNLMRRGLNASLTPLGVQPHFKLAPETFSTPGAPRADGKRARRPGKWW